MTLPVTETMSPPEQRTAPPTRRRQNSDVECLVLSELNPQSVVDDLDDDGDPIHVMTFGSVRETCPKCRSSHLKLVLRQSAVRIAHLFCPDCAGCFDAHYPNGASALTI
jgi:hypothetical protein